MKENSRFKQEITWEEKANGNPLFAVMSDNIFLNKDKNITKEDLSLFYSKGQLLWNRYFSDLINNLINRDDITIVEFGCGMGRILSVPASLGFNCIGIDISETQLDLAKKHFPTKENTTFIQSIPKSQFNIEEESVDLIYSFAVFQHIKNVSDVLYSLDELVRILKRGGIMRIQFRCPNKFFYQLNSFGFNSINFEKSTILFYFKKLFKIPIPIIRYVQHDNWSGAGCYISYSRMMKYFLKRNFKVLNISFETTDQKIIWLTVQK